MKTYISSKIYNQKESKDEFIERMKKEAKERQIIPIVFNGEKKMVMFGTEGQIITSFGKFQMIPAKVLFGKWGWHYVLLYPNLETLLKKKEIILRLDSGCFSGMIFGDTTCDCHEQLKLAQKYCVKNKGGIVIHIPEQDGRGNKYSKMAEKRLFDELNMSYAKAAKAFYEKDELIDIRTYDESAIILKALGFKNHTFRMATNNPKKVRAFKDAGMKLSGVKSVCAKNPNKFVKKRLKSKQESWGHNFKSKLQKSS